MKILKLRVTGLCEGNSPVTGEFPAQRVSNVENVSIWWRHNGLFHVLITKPRTHYSLQFKYLLIIMIAAAANMLVL